MNTDRLTLTVSSKQTLAFNAFITPWIKLDAAQGDEQLTPNKLSGVISGTLAHLHVSLLLPGPEPSC